MHNWVTQLDHSFIELLEMFFQIILSAFLGGIVGWERERRQNISLAGVRTFAAISMGSCAFGLISIYGAQEAWPAADPTRIAAQVASGIGFIGTGVIFRDSGKQRGLTTAAGLWATGAVGLSVAYKLYLVSIVSTTIIFSLLLLSHFTWWKNLLGKGVHYSDEEI